MFTGASRRSSPCVKTIRSSTSVGDAVDLAHDQLRGVERLGVARARSQDLGGAADAAERIPHLVRDAGRDPPEDLERLALRDELLERALDGAVAQHEHDAVGLAARHRAAARRPRRRAARRRSAVRSGARSRRRRARSRARVARARESRGAGPSACSSGWPSVASLDVPRMRQASAFESSTRPASSSTTTPSSTASSTLFGSRATATRPACGRRRTRARDRPSCRHRRRAARARGRRRCRAAPSRRP